MKNILIYIYHNILHYPHTGKREAALRLWMGLLCLILLASCARMGRPDGGWYDETPPHVVAAYPEDGGTNVTAKKVRILFDEFIKIENATEKVVVSPPQMEQAEIRCSLKTRCCLIQPTQ